MAEVNSSDLTQALDDLAYSNTTKEIKQRGSSELGKDEFLKLLVCQLQNQDPLNPQDDTSFIAQLAQFSSLEQMQNMNATMTNTSAYTLVGKEVIVQTTDSSGATKEVRGTVDSVKVQNGNATLCIDGVNYDLDDLIEVLDDMYAIQKYLPSVEKQELVYDMSNPTMSTVTINLGSDGYQASSVAVSINGNYIDSSLMTYNDGVLSIAPKAFEGIAPGTYKLTFQFDDPYGTTISDKVTVKITKSGVSGGTTDEDTENTDDTTKDTEEKENTVTE